MILAFAGTLGLLAQAAALPTTAVPTAAPIRVWRSDSTLYVRLRDPGYLTVLQVDPVGRIRVLFPFNPDDNAAAPGSATFELAVPGDADDGTGTILAARTRQPLQVAGLRAGRSWDYENGLLFQPTAGDPTAALLDIAERLAGGHPYDFDVATYRTGGPVAARDPQLTTPVCLGCVRSYPVQQQSTVVIDQSNNVDCSSALLVNSFCGVVDNRVTNTYVYNEVAPAPEPVYVPYYIPVLIPRRRRASPPPAPPQRTLALAFPLRRASAVVVPPPPRRRPVIDVKQPRQRYAPMEPRQREEPDGGSPLPAAMPRGPARRAPPPAVPAVPHLVNWVGAGMPVRTPTSWEPDATRAAEPAAQLPQRQAGTMSVPTTQSRTFVPSSSLLRSLRTRPH